MAIFNLSQNKWQIEAYFKGGRGWALSFLAGSITQLAMAPYHFYLIPFLTFPLLVLLLEFGCLESASKNWRRLFWCGFKVGWFFGLGYFAAGFFWIYNAFLVEADKFAFLIPIVLILMPSILAVFYALACGLAVVFWPKLGLAGRLLVLAISFASIEWVRGELFTGFPWHAVGYAMTSSQLLAQSASLIGISGLNLLAVIFFTLPVIVFDFKSLNSIDRIFVAGVIGLMGIAAIYGVFTRAPLSPEGVPTRLYLVQPNILQKHKWKKEKELEIIQTYLELTRQAAKRIQDYQNSQPEKAAKHLIIWPESAMPFLIRRDEKFRAVLGDILPNGSFLITGNVRLEQIGNKRSAYNSVLVLDDEGKVSHIFDKKHLVPFGEYVPLKTFFSAIGFSQLANSHGSFSAGKQPRYIKLDKIPAFAPLICYEALFPNEIYTSGPRPDWLLNITNDGWYQLSNGPHQHFHQSRIRAIEQGLPMIRVGNTGITAVIDAGGKVLVSKELGTKGVVVHVLPPKYRPTLYARFGEWVFLFLLVVSILMTFLLSNRQKI